MGAPRRLFDVQQKPFLTSFLFLLPLFILAHFFFHSYFNVNDDDWVVFFSKGVGLSLRPDAHIFTNNILLGYLLKFLYTRFPSLNWYTYGLVLAEFLAFWAFLASLFLSPHPKLKKWLFVVAFAFYGIYFCVDLNYTMEGLLLAQGGLFLLIVLYGRTDHPFRNGILALGFPCLAFSFLLRSESFFLATLTALPFVLFTFWGKPPSLKKLAPLLALGLGLGACQAWNDLCYQSDPGWKGFVRDIVYFRKFYDWRNMDYTEDMKPYFDQVGWSRNDAAMFKEYFFMNRDKYNIPNLQKLGEHLPLASIQGKKGNAGSLEQVVFGNPFSMNMLTCFLFFFLFAPPKKFPLLVVSYAWTAGVILLLMYFAQAPERIYLPCWTFVANLALFCAVPPKDPDFLPGTPACLPSKKVLLLASALIFLMSVPVIRFYQGLDWVCVRQSALFKASLKALHPKEDQLFVVWGSDLFHEYLDAFDDFEIYRNFHIFIFGSWSISPYGTAMLDHFGIKDICRGLVDRPDVFLICNPERGQMLHQYMLENYRMDIRAQKVFEGFHFSVYHLVQGGELRGGPKEH